MKKYVFLFGFILIALIILSIKPSYGLELSNEKEVRINSQEFLEYVEKENITNISKICAGSFCDYMRSANPKKALSIFTDKYRDYIEKTIGEEAALEVYVKGFFITKIETLN